MSVVAALAAPPVALGLRWNDARHAQEHLARGVALLEVPMERGTAPESLDWHHAEEAFAQARSLHGDEAEVRRATALWHAARALGDLARGEVVLSHTESQTAARLAPDEPAVMYVQALVTLRRGDSARAERLFEALSRAPGAAALRARAGVHRIDLLLDAGRGHDALALAESLDREFARCAPVANRVGLARAAVGDQEGARQAFDRAREINARDATPLVNLARLARTQGDLAGARGLLEQALGVEPESGEAWLAYGVVLAESGPESARPARMAIVKAAQLSPADSAPWVAQGDLDLREEHWTDAVASFRQALERNAEDVAARTNLGVALARTGDTRGARAAFLEVTQRAPGVGAAWNGLGAMRLALHDAEGAVGALQQASVLLPDDPNPALNLGRALEKLQRWNDAVAAFRESLRRDPANEVALRHLAALQPGSTSVRASLLALRPSRDTSRAMP